MLHNTGLVNRWVNLAASAVLMAAAGCSSALVTFPARGGGGDAYGDQVTVEVSASANKNSGMGIKMVKLAEYGEARHYFETAVAESPNDYQSHFALGALYEKEGDMEKAARHYRSAFLLNDRDEYAVAYRRAAGKNELAEPAQSGEATAASPASPAAPQRTAPSKPLGEDVYQAK